MTRVFYDTEFHEDGRTIDLISIGLVREDTGEELYLINGDCDTTRLLEHDWLMANVVPSLPLTATGAGLRLLLWDPDKPDIDRVRLRPHLAAMVCEFITGTPDPQLWAWYGAYDHVALAQLWGPMIHLPEGIPMWTGDLRQEAERLGAYEGRPKQEAGEHNALADARHNLAIARYLDGVADSQQAHYLEPGR